MKSYAVAAAIGLMALIAPPPAEAIPLVWNFGGSITDYGGLLSGLTYSGNFIWDEANATIAPDGSVVPNCPTIGCAPSASVPMIAFNLTIGTYRFDMSDLNGGIGVVFGPMGSSHWGPGAVIAASSLPYGLSQLWLSPGGNVFMVWVEGNTGMSGGSTQATIANISTVPSPNALVLSLAGLATLFARAAFRAKPAEPHAPS